MLNSLKLVQVYFQYESWQMKWSLLNRPVEFIKVKYKCNSNTNQAHEMVFIEWAFGVRVKLQSQPELRCARVHQSAI